MAGAWTYWGWKGGYFDSEDDARAFYDEHCFMLAAQMCAPNSPQWFNTGLHWAYGIDGPGQGHWFVDHRDGEVHPSSSAYERPQPHACFIQSVADDLVSEGGIMDLWVREARLFKYGSGTGSNFSAPARRGRAAVGRRQVVRPDVASSRSATGRRAPSSRAARRGARPRWSSVDIDHPDIEEFIAWKMLEEQKVAALVAGSQARQPASQRGDARLPRRRWRRRVRSASKNPALRRAIVAARQAELPENYIQRVIQFAAPGLPPHRVPGLRHRLGVARPTSRVSGQNANNSVRVTDAFLRAVEAGPRLGADRAHRRARSPRR